MCILTQYFTRSTNTQENGNVYKKAVFSPTFVVSLFRDVAKCQRPCACVRLEPVQPKGRTGKEKGRRLYILWKFFKELLILFHRISAVPWGHVASTMKRAPTEDSSSFPTSTAVSNRSIRSSP